MMTNQDIREMTDKQIREHIADEDLNLTRMRLTHSVSPLENPMKLVTTRKYIARLKTEQRRREIEASETAGK